MAEGSSSGTEVPVSDAVTGTEVRVSGADTGAVMPVRAAVTTASTLSEADHDCYHCRQGDEKSPAANSRWHIRVSNVVGR